MVFTLEPLGKPHQSKMGMTEDLTSPETAAGSQRTNMIDREGGWNQRKGDVREGGWKGPLRDSGRGPGG